MTNGAVTAGGAPRRAPGARNRGRDRRSRIVLVALAVVTALAVLPLPAAGGEPWEGRRPRLARLANFDPGAPPFRVRSFDLEPLPWDDLYPHDRKLPPVAARLPVDAQGVPMRREDGVLYYTPTGIAMEGNRRIAAYLRTGDEAYLEAVVIWASRLRRLMAQTDEALWLPFPWRAKNQGLQPPWYNALGQGSALAFYARLYRLTGDQEYLDTAHGLFASFLQVGPLDGPWAGQVGPSGHLWLEHYPEGRRLRVLNAHLYAAFGLRDYWEITGTPLARLMTEAAFTTIRARGTAFRRPGTWSWYNLFRRVAHRNYHQFHVRQLRAAAVATGDPWFRDLADLMVSDYQP
jgi:hypothetical protein